MKKFEVTRNLLISHETHALIADLDQKSFFSPIHQAVVEVFGTNVTCNGEIVAQIRSEADIGYWWSEWRHQAEKGGAR